MTIESHANWATANFALEPVAADIGPFALRDFLQTWWQLRARGEVVLVESTAALLMLERIGSTVHFLGEADLFDYHSPLGPGSRELIAEWAAALEGGTLIDLDSMPGAAADVVISGLVDAGLRPTATAHETAAVLALPDDYESYLASLDKKQRHEARRKRRRFDESLGSPRLERETGAAAAARFSAMHRRADGRKGRFMDREMEKLFAAFHVEAGAVIDFLYGEAARPVAAAYGFENGAAYYLYNSAYDPDAAAASPGIVLIAELIRQSIHRGLSRFDFLKGDEAYKYRLGARPRPLWRVTASAG